MYSLVLSIVSTVLSPSKALSRLNEMVRKGEVHKTYLALTANKPPKTSDTLIGWLVRNEKQNKSYCYDHEVPGSKKAILEYREVGHTDNYT